MVLYFLVESIFIFVLSIMDLEESDMEVVELSVFTVVESVLELEDPDPQAARKPTNTTVNNFFILNSLK
jgi:hypothetical protein